jgi:hypothetical protein
MTRVNFRSIFSVAMMLTAIKDNQRCKAKEPRCLENARPEPKGQHTVPASYLAGFSEDGTKDGRLWVTDKLRRKQFAGTPKTCGRENHFYTAEWGNGVDRYGVEKAFGRLETKWAPIIERAIFDSRLLPSESEEMADLLMFVATQAMRTGSAREQIGALFHQRQKQTLITRLEDGRDWDGFVDYMRSIGECVEISREELLESSHQDDYVITADKPWTIQAQLRSALNLFPHLCGRHWSLFTAASDACDFVCSDAPVSVTFTDGRSAIDHGFCERQSVVTVPLGRRHALAGFYEGNLDMTLPHSEVAALNTMTIQRATRIYFQYLRDDGEAGDSLDFQTTSSYGDA